MRTNHLKSRNKVNYQTENSGGVSVSPCVRVNMLWRVSAWVQVSKAPA